MILIIDGYNLLKNVLKTEFITQSQRDEYINVLNAYAQKKKHSVILVFDGGNYDRPIKEKAGNCTIVYTGQHQSADDYIKQYAATAIPSQNIVVSSDRALKNYVHRYDIMTLDVPDFYALLQEALQKKDDRATPTKIEKLSQEENDELDRIMFASTKVMLKKEDEQEKSRESLGRTLKKHKRKIVQKIKKL